MLNALRANSVGKIIATPPTSGAAAPGAVPPAAGAAAAPAAPDGGAAANADNSLPDPTHRAVRALGFFVALAALVAILMNAFGWTAKPFIPAATATANFALFAGFYVAAQVIERLMQLVTPYLPWWSPPSTVSSDPAVQAAQTKADRGTVALGVAAVLGVAGSCGFGLFFLSAIGIHVNHTVDAFLTGITVAAGTKPLHDFISLLQNQNTPTTGTGTSTNSTGTS